MPAKIRPPTPEDRPAWEPLYEGYARFYRVEQTPEMRARVWGWLMDPGHELRGLVAADEDGQLLGLAHFRPFSRPLSATVGGWLDDLFVTPEARGQKLAETMIAAISEEGRVAGWSVIRWITAEDNYRARSAYDRLAERTKWVTYDIKL